MQGIIKSYDPVTRDGVIVTDNARMDEYEIAAGAVKASIFRMLRPGQRVNFELDAENMATDLGFGSETDMKTLEPN